MGDASFAEAGRHLPDKTWWLCATGGCWKEGMAGLAPDRTKALGWMMVGWGGGGAEGVCGCSPVPTPRSRKEGEQRETVLVVVGDVRQSNGCLPKRGEGVRGV